MPDPYRPCNGDEGEWFMGEWCRRCERDQRRDRPCRIIGLTMALAMDDPGYPPEWVTDNDEGPRCTAFRPINPKHRRPGRPERPAPGQGALL